MLKKSMSIPSVGFSILYFQTTLMGLMVLGGITSCLAESETIQWWTDPCKQKIPPVLDKLRHGRSADNRAVIIDQLNILISGNKMDMRDLEKLYSRSNETIRIPKGRYKWLNVKKMIRDMQTPKGYNSKLKKLHNSLQLFAGTLETLSQIQLQSQGKFNRKKRKSIIYDIKLRLKAFICAVEEALKFSNKTTKNLILKDMNIVLPEHANLTKLYSLDVNILKKFKLFLSQVKRKVLRKPRRMRNGRNGVRIHTKNKSSPLERILRNRSS